MTPCRHAQVRIDQSLCEGPSIIRGALVCAGFAQVTLLLNHLLRSTWRSTASSTFPGQ